MIKSINFLKFRYVFLAVSALIIIGGIAFGMVTGYKFDIDFKGGTRIQVDLKESFDEHELSKIVEDTTGKTPIVQKMSSGDSSVIITTDSLSNENADSLVAALKAKYTNMDEPSTKNIQPSYGKDLVNSAVLALTVAIVILLIYIGIRFRNLGINAAVTAIIALIHDALMVIAVYGVIKFPINSTFIAVILTIIGYSINDTIIVYDRIRENRKKITKVNDLKEIINMSITQTMRRTMYTSLTTIVSIAIVYVISAINNQQVLMEFSLPLVIGVIIGTYSSIFVASSLWYIFEEIREKNKERKSLKKSKNKTIKK